MVLMIWQGEVFEDRADVTEADEDGGGGDDIFFSAW